MAQYHVYYRKNNSECRTALNMDFPSESMALELLRRQGTINSSDRVYIIRIERA